MYWRLIYAFTRGKSLLFVQRQAVQERSARKETCAYTCVPTLGNGLGLAFLKAATSGLLLQHRETGIFATTGKSKLGTCFLTQQPGGWRAAITTIPTLSIRAARVPGVRRCQSLLPIRGTPGGLPACSSRMRLKAQRPTGGLRPCPRLPWRHHSGKARPAWSHR